MPWAGSGGRKVAQNRPKWLLGHENGPAKSEAGLVASLKCGPEAGRGAGGGGGIGCFGARCTHERERESAERGRVRTCTRPRCACARWLSGGHVARGIDETSRSRALWVLLAASSHVIVRRISIRLRGTRGSRHPSRQPATPRTRPTDGLSFSY